MPCLGGTIIALKLLLPTIPLVHGLKVSRLADSSLLAFANSRQVDIGIDDVQIDSSLGYTNYMIYQAQDTTIRGANVTWAAENTTIAQNTQNQPDTWTLQYNGQEVHALRGTHLSITAVKTVSNGAAMLAFFQEEGDDMKMYTRDAYNSGGLWQQAAQDPVAPTKS